MRIVYLILLVCVVSTTGQTRIAGGEKATRAQFPYFAQLRMFTKDKRVLTVCGASLINERWLLSAAHCFYDLNLKDLQILADKNLLIVYMGSNVRYSNKASKNFVKSVVLHPDFTVKFDATGDIMPWKNDIALLFLKKKYKLNNFIKLIQLPKPIRDFNKWVQECKTVAVVGIGANKPQTNPSENTRIVRFVMYSKERPKSFKEVRKVFEEHRNLDADEIDYFNRVIITQSEWLRGHAVQGDSGGPAICYGRKKPILYGIASGILQLPMGKNASYFGFYERVDKHLIFIQSRGKNLKKHKKKRGEVVKPKPMFND